MQHITKSLSGQNSRRSEKKQDLTRPSKVWVQLAEMFGNGFLRENGDEPPTLWTQAVWRLTDAQITAGLANLGNEGLGFPPNLSQFVQACKRPAPRKEWIKSTAIEDKRESGRMSRLEWTKQWKE
jgi:hypothetical protein